MLMSAQVWAVRIYTYLMPPEIGVGGALADPEVFHYAKYTVRFGKQQATVNLTVIE